jgi:hypothetical protein
MKGLSKELKHQWPLHNIVLFDTNSSLAVLNNVS